MNGYYLSFADGEKFRGAVQLTAETIEEAISRSHKLGLNPGGEVLVAGPFDPAAMPGSFETLWTTEAEVDEAFANYGGAGRLPL